MIIKKMSGTLAVAAVLLGLNTVAMADLSEDCLDTIASIELKAAELRYCSSTDDAIPGPIWQYKRNGDGCVIHEKLARKLDELRTEEPPPVKKGKNTSSGAANDFLNGKFEAGYLKLMDFSYALDASRVIEGQESRDAAVRTWIGETLTDALACQ